MVGEIPWSLSYYCQGSHHVRSQQLEDQDQLQHSSYQSWEIPKSCTVYVAGWCTIDILQDLFLSIISPVWFVTVMTFTNLAVCLTTPTQCIVHFDCGHAQCPTIWKLITQTTSTLHFAFITQSDICTSYWTNFKFYDSWIIVSLYNLKGMPCSPIVRYYKCIYIIHKTLWLI